MPRPTPPRFDPWPPDHRPTPFQVAVVALVQAIEAGDLLTYGEVADHLGRPGAGQAVANVLRRAPDLPWWRIVPADGRVYCSHRPTQVPLLRSEGHAVDDEGQIGPRPRSTRRATA